MRVTTFVPCWNITAGTYHAIVVDGSQSSATPMKTHTLRAVSPSMETESIALPADSQATQSA